MPCQLSVILAAIWTGSLPSSTYPTASVLMPSDISRTDFSLRGTWRWLCYLAGMVVASCCYSRCDAPTGGVFWHPYGRHLHGHFKFLPYVTFHYLIAGAAASVFNRRMRRWRPSYHTVALRAAARSPSPLTCRSSANFYCRFVHHTGCALTLFALFSSVISRALVRVHCVYCCSTPSPTVPFRAQHNAHAPPLMSVGVLCYPFSVPLTGRAFATAFLRFESWLACVVPLRFRTYPVGCARRTFIAVYRAGLGCCRRSRRRCSLLLPCVARGW